MVNTHAAHGAASPQQKPARSNAGRLHLHMKTRKSWGSPLTDPKEARLAGVRSN